MLLNRMMPELLDHYDYEVTKLIMEKYGCEEMDALERFLTSKTHDMLADMDMGLWQFGPAGILDIWESEQVTGDPRNSRYIRGDAA